MKKNQNAFSVGKILLVTAALILAALLGRYVWHKKHAQIQASDSTVINFNEVTINSAPLNGQNVKPQLIQDQTTLEKVWKELYKANKPPVTPQVDFKTNSLVLVTYSAPSGGYSVSIDKISESSSSVVVAYTVDKPGDNCVATDSLVLNYELATIPKTDKHAIFSQSEKTHTC